MDGNDNLESFEEQLLDITTCKENLDERVDTSDQNLDKRIDAPKIGLESFEEQLLDITTCEENLDERVDTSDQNLDKRIDAPKIGQTFNNWDELDQYDNGVCRSRLYACEHQGHNAMKKKTCILRINSLYLSHNDHSLKDETNKFAVKYRTFSEEMLNDIKFWTEAGDLNMRTQYQMLMKRYPDVFFLPQDLSNTIQVYKRQSQVECESAVLLNYLLERKAEDTGWVVNWKVDPANNSLTSLFWMSPDQHDLYVRYRDIIQHDNTYSTNRFKISLGFFVIVDNNNRSRLVGQVLMNDETAKSYEWVLETLITNTGNLIKNLKEKLGNQYNEFSQHWYQMRNSLSYQQFDYLSNKLLAKFPDSAAYLNRALFNEKKHWALCYTSKVFTAGMQSTQRVEGQNAIIKNSVNGNTSLINLSKHIDEQIGRASTFIQYKNWMHSITDLDEQLDFNEQSNSTEAFDTFIEDTVDALSILLKELIPSTEVESVLEVWEVSRHRRNAKNYVQIEPESQTREHSFVIGLENNKNPVHEQSFPDLSFCLPNISFGDIHTKINHRKAYVTISRLLKKAIQTGLDSGSNAIQELKNLMNGFISKYTPKKKERKNIKQHEDKDEATSDSSSSDDDFVSVEDPVVHPKRGTPKKKRIKGSHEFASTSKSKQSLEVQKNRKPTQCQQCQNTGHNKAGCEVWHKQEGIPYSY
ncbi:14858_t:CDS:2 [Gigaspora rosea]|nr:14858_t:CDS:2 [Gigaspora rosea]